MALTIILFCILINFHLNSASSKWLDIYDNRHNESCYADSECPILMQCKLDDINLCVCQSGYTFSHPSAKCEPSKKIFRNFWIDGPTRINLTRDDVHFEVKFINTEDQRESDWQYEWQIQDGHEFANFSDLNTSKLIFSELVPGFILFSISISNDTAYGYIPHNLTILDYNKAMAKSDKQSYESNQPIAIAINLTVTLPLSRAILTAVDSKNAAYFKWTPFDDIPATMLTETSLNYHDMLLTNLIPGRHFFNLTVVSNEEIEDKILVEVQVLKGIAEINSVEILIKNEDLHGYFTYSQHKTISSQIEQILSQQIGNQVEIKFTQIHFDTENGLIQLIFYAYLGKDDKNVIGTRKVITILNNNSTFKREFAIMRINKLYGISSCSGHGFYSNTTRNCICDNLWMPNLINLFLYSENEDCAWSVVGLWIFVFLTVLLIWKVIRIILAKKEQRLNTQIEKIRKLLNPDPARKHLSFSAGRFSPIKMFINGKIRQDSVKGVLDFFDKNKMNDEQKCAGRKRNEESDCYDEEEEDE